MSSLHLETCAVFQYVFGCCTVHFTVSNKLPMLGTWSSVRNLQLMDSSHRTRILLYLSSILMMAKLLHKSSSTLTTVLSPLKQGAWSRPLFLFRADLGSQGPRRAQRNLGHSTGPPLCLINFSSPRLIHHSNVSVFRCPRHGAANTTHGSEARIYQRDVPTDLRA